MQNHPLIWTVVSFIGLLGLLCALSAVVLMAYTAISHLGRADKKIAWSWRRGVVPFAIRLFAVGLSLQLLSFVARIVLGNL